MEKTEIQEAFSVDAKYSKFKVTFGDGDAVIVAAKTLLDVAKKYTNAIAITELGFIKIVVLNSDAKIIFSVVFADFAVDVIANTFEEVAYYCSNWDDAVIRIVKNYAIDAVV